MGELLAVGERTEAPVGEPPPGLSGWGELLTTDVNNQLSPYKFSEDGTQRNANLDNHEVLFFNRMQREVVF